MKRRRATDSNVITVSLWNGDNSLIVFALGVLIGYGIARFIGTFSDALEPTP